jgi:hypothetical protein
MEMTELTQSTPDFTELLRKVQESLQAGRIDLDQAETMRRIIRDGDSSCDLNTLRYFEKLHTFRPYLEVRGLRFTIREFTYHFQLPDSEKQKIAAVLEEALMIIKIDRGLGGSK